MFGILSVPLLSCDKVVFPWSAEHSRCMLSWNLCELLSVFQAVMIAYPVCHDVIRNAYQLANHLLYFIDVQVRYSIRYIELFSFHTEKRCRDLAVSLHVLMYQSLVSVNGSLKASVT